MLHIKLLVLMQRSSKGCIGSFVLLLIFRILHGKFKFTEFMVETVREVVIPFMQVGKITRQGISATLEPVRVTAARLLEFPFLSFHLSF